MENEQKILDELVKLNSLLKRSTFKFDLEAPSYIDGTRLANAVNMQDYLRALQLGGYGYTITYPLTSSLVAGNYPLMIFNQGFKSLLFHSIQGSAGGGGNVNFQFMPISNNITYANIAIQSNRKIGISNLPAILATYAITSQAIPSIPVTQTYEVVAGATQELLTNGQIFILPSKQGLLIFALNGATTSIGLSVIGVELPF